MPVTSDPGEHGRTARSRWQVVNDLIAKEVDGSFGRIGPLTFQQNARRWARRWEGPRRPAFSRSSTWDSDSVGEGTRLFRLAYVARHKLRDRRETSPRAVGRRRFKPQGATSASSSGGAGRGPNPNGRVFYAGHRDPISGTKERQGRPAPSSRPGTTAGPRWPVGRSTPTTTPDWRFQQMEDILGQVSQAQNAFIRNRRLTVQVHSRWPTKKRRRQKDKSRIADGSLALVVADTMPVQIELLKGRLVEGPGRPAAGRRWATKGTMSSLKDIIKDGKPAPKDRPYNGPRRCTAGGPPATASRATSDPDCLRGSGLVVYAKRPVASAGKSRAQRLPNGRPGAR